MSVHALVLSVSPDTVMTTDSHSLSIVRGGAGGGAASHNVNN